MEHYIYINLIYGIYYNLQSLAIRVSMKWQWKVEQYLIVNHFTFTKGCFIWTAALIQVQHIEYLATGMPFVPRSDIDLSG